MLVEQLINDQITEEDFLAAYEKSSQEEQAVLLSELLETYGRSPDGPKISVRKALLRLQKDVLDNYGRNKLSSAADTVIETLFEQLRLDRVAKAELGEFETRNDILKKLTLGQVVDPQVTRVTISPDGDRSKENLGVDYNHEFIEITPNKELSDGGEELTQLSQISDTLSQWGERYDTAIDALLYLEINLLVNEIIAGEQTTNKFIVITRGPDNELAAVGLAEIRNQEALEPYVYIAFTVANPDSQLPLENRPEGTLLRAGTANRIAMLRYIAKEWPQIERISSDLVHERAVQGALDSYFFNFDGSPSLENSFPFWDIFSQPAESYAAAHQSLLQRKIPYLERVVQDLERAAMRNSVHPDLVAQISEVKGRISELENHPGQLTNETIEQLRTSLAQQIRELDFQYSQNNIQAALGYEANRLREDSVATRLQDLLFSGLPPSLDRSNPRDALSYLMENRNTVERRSQFDRVFEAIREGRLSIADTEAFIQASTEYYRELKERNTGAQDQQRFREALGPDNLRALRDTEGLSSQLQTNWMNC